MSDGFSELVKARPGYAIDMLLVILLVGASYFVEPFAVVYRNTPLGSIGWIISLFVSPIIFLVVSIVLELSVKALALIFGIQRY